jgi:hypothetical protein
MQVFILDGLDELPLEFEARDRGFMASNGVLYHWTHAKFVITCRSEYLLTLASRINRPYQEHLTGGKTKVEELFLMPFSDAQVSTFPIILLLSSSVD